MTLASLVRRELIFPDLPGPDRQSVLHAIADRFAAAGFIEGGDHLYGKLLEREELGTTCVVPGVAIPHCKLEDLDNVLVSVGICPDGAAFGGPEDEPVKLFFTVISPASDPAAHLQALALISRWIKVHRHVERLVALSDADEMMALIHTMDEEDD